MTERQENTGEFSVSLATKLGQINLKNDSIEELYFIEDIFSFSMTGKLIFYDKYGVFEFGPLTGNEKLTVYYGIENDIEKVFYIYKMAKIQSDSSANPGSKQTIELYFTDEMFYSLNFIQFSKSWKNEKVSNIIYDIAENIMGVSSWNQKENSLDTMDYFYSPYWSPNTSINWLMKRSKGSKSRKASYVFFNNSKGSNFITLDTLLSQTKLLKISNKDDGLYVFESENLFLFNKILSWSISGLDNTALRRISGETNLGYDSSTKNFIINEKKYTDQLKNHTILGKFSLFTDKSEIRNGFRYLGEDNEKIIENIYSSDWNKLYDSQQLINITVRGHEERYCGAMIEIKWPSTEKFEQQFNSNLHGLYLIKSITHYFSGQNTPAYIQKMNLIKNGYEESENTDLVKSTAKNLVK